MQQGQMVTLCDGREVPSSSQEFAMECLARWVMRMGPAKRKAWMAGCSERMQSLVSTEITRIKQSIPANE
ncbi:MAG: hypothetical protein WCE42_02210 [Rhizobium ruizarguesonis]